MMCTDDERTPLEIEAFFITKLTELLKDAVDLSDEEIDKVIQNQSYPELRDVVSAFVALPALSRGMTLLYENDRDNLERIHSDMQNIIDGIAKVLKHQISRILEEAKK